VEPEERAIAKQQLSNHRSTAADTHATIEELFEAMFSMLTMPRLYNESLWVH
jgi:hypothetical protein